MSAPTGPGGPAFPGITDLLRAYRHGENDPLTATRALLARIERLDGTINAYIAVRAAPALAEAAHAAQLWVHGRPAGALCGIPIAVKDLFITPERAATFGVPDFRGGPPGAWAGVLARLRAAGAILIGFTNLDAFALGSFNANPHYGQVRNPWDLQRHAGGSSGGSAAAVAAGMAAAAIGTDTGVSIRQPAAVTGLVGLKPSFGLVGRGGCLPFSPTLDHVGPIAPTVEDTVRLLVAIAGADPEDYHALPAADIAAACEPAAFAPPPDLSGTVIGVAQDPFWTGCDPGTRIACEAALDRLARLGARLTALPLPHAADLNAVQSIIAQHEAAAFHCAAADWRDRTMGPAFRAFLARGLARTPAAYAEALAARTRMSGDLDRAIRGVDMVAMPTTPHVATPVSEGPEAGETIRWRNTGPFTASGHPAVSIPCGVSPEGLPVGLQLVGPFLGDLRLLALAAVAERAFGPRRSAPV